MTQCNICLFNDDTPTYLHPATGSFTSIDLAMCSPSHFMDFTWRVEDDLHSSGHLPIILESHHHAPDNRPSRWQNKTTPSLALLSPYLIPGVLAFQI